MPEEIIEKVVSFRINTFGAIVIALVSSSLSFGYAAGQYRQEFEGLRGEIAKTNIELAKVAESLKLQSDVSARIDGRLDSLQALLSQQFKTH